MRRRRFAYAEVLRRLQKKLAPRGSQRALALTVGISQSYLSDIALGRRRVPDAVLRVIGLRRVEEYEDRPPDTTRRKRAHTDECA